LNAFRFLADADFPSCVNGTNRPTYSVLDLDSDGHVDLVVTGACNDDKTGTSRWLVYKGTASGFASTPTDFALPGGYSSNAFGSLANANYTSCVDGWNMPIYSVLDLDGDGHLDLVLTEACNDDKTGTSRWLIYKGQCGM
jgi:hypothetical protein